MSREAISHAQSSPGTILREGGAGDEPGEPCDGRGSTGGGGVMGLLHPINPGLVT